MTKDINKVVNSISDKYLIEGLIDSASKIFGRDNLSSGNCGNFALALASILIEKGLSPKIGILHFCDEDEYFDSIEDLSISEPNIYHVVLINDDKIYDSTGEIKKDYLIDFSIREYHDDQPMFMEGIDIKDENEYIALKTLCDFDTDWSISQDKFYNSIKCNKPKKSLKI